MRRVPGIWRVDVLWADRLPVLSRIHTRHPSLPSSLLPLRSGHQLLEPTSCHSVIVRHVIQVKSFASDLIRTMSNFMRMAAHVKLKVAIGLALCLALGAFSWRPSTTRTTYLLYPVGLPIDTRPCRALASAIHHGFEPSLLVLHDADHYYGNLRKVAALHDFLTKVVRNRDDLIGFVDAFDTWVQETPAELLAKFESLGTGILFAADKVCWPEGQTPTCLDVPDSTLPHDVYGNVTDTDFPLNRPRWLNSGVVFGRAHAMQKLTTDVKKFIRWWYNYHGELPASDQSFFAAHFVSSGEDGYDMSLDYGSLISHTLSYAHDDSAFSEEAGAFVNTVTHTRPTFVHFAGPTMKEDMPTMFRSNPWVVVTPASTTTTTSTSTKKGDTLSYVPDLERKLSRAQISVVNNGTVSRIPYRSFCGLYV